MKKTKILLPIGRAINLLSEQDRKKYLKAVCVQALLAVLDLIGVVLLGLVASITVKGIQSVSPDSRIGQFLTLVSLGDLDFRSQVIILSCTAVAFLSVKTILSLHFNRKMLRFLSVRASVTSAVYISKWMNQDFQTIKSKSSNEVQYILGQGISALCVGVLGLFSALVSDLFLLSIIIFSVLLIDPIVAVLSLSLFGMIAFVLFRLFNDRANKVGIQISKFTIESNTQISEVVETFKEIYVRNRRYYYANKFAKLKSSYALAIADQIYIPNISKYLAEITITVGGLLVAAVQFSFRDASQAAAGFAIFMVAGSRIAPAMLRIQQNLIQIQSSLGLGNPTLALISELQYVNVLEPIKLNWDSTHDGFEPHVEIHNLQFSYAQSSISAITIDKLIIPSGSFIAIIGPSGAGKSSLVDLMLGLQTQSSGIITISGVSPKDAIFKWPGAIGYVPQEVGLIDSSIFENITVGFEPTEFKINQVKDALSIARLSSFIESLPDGLETQIGERGTKLSGGQRQRIGIARAMLTKPKLLILDEATSSLDGQTEQEITEAIQNLKGKVTVVMIAHRLSTVRNADLVLYLDNAELIATGTFDEVRKAVPDFDSQASLIGL